jgi:Tol biopolymer transport system component
MRLTSGEGEVSPRFSPDGRWVVYQGGYQTGATIWRVPVDGGDAIRLTETRAQKPDVSPDGKLIAYHTMDSQSATSPWIFGAMPFDGGPLIRKFTFGPSVGERIVRWVPGGWGLAYLDTAGGVSNIWVQPLDGGPPLQLSDFKAERIDSFDWSPDGRRLAVVRGTETSDVVLIEARSQMIRDRERNVNAPGTWSGAPSRSRAKCASHPNTQSEKLCRLIQGRHNLPYHQMYRL